MHARHLELDFTNRPRPLEPLRQFPTRAAESSRPGKTGDSLAAAIGGFIGAGALGNFSS